MTEMLESQTELKDEDLKLKEIDQLHSAIIEFSKKCFETKKIFLTLIVTLTTVVNKFNGNKIDYKNFLALLLIIVLFWSLDAESYYYQEKLRQVMKKIMNEIRGARKIEITDGVGIPLSKSRKQSNMRVRSFFNRSQFMYMILIIMDLLGFIFYICKLIFYICKWKYKW